jgi:Tol biopolymer transport system component
VLTHDAARVVFRTIRGMYWLATDGSGRAQPIRGSSSVIDIPSSVSPDNRTLAFVRQTADMSGDVYVVSLDDTAPPRALVSTPAYEGGPQFSPDGRWMAFTSDESGRTEVYVRPYSGPDRRWLVSTQGGSHPLWNRNGRELFYRSANKMMGVSVTTGPEIVLSAPRLLFEQRYSFTNQSIASYDVSPDGQRFVMVKNESDSGRLNLVLNWFEDLRRLAPSR